MSATRINILTLDKFDPKDVVIPITYQLSDFRDISSRNGHSTKTIKLPATKKNSTILGFPETIRGESYFNRKLRNNAFIETDSNRILEGSLKIIRTSIKNKTAIYETTLLGNNSEWTDLIKDKSIKDLTFATHTVNEDTIRDSWTKNGDTGEFVYPLIDYGLFRSKTSSFDVQNTDLRPAVFVKEILRKIFADLDYVIISDFFKRPAIRDLILLHTTGDIDVSDEFKEQQKAEAFRLFSNAEVPLGASDIVYDQEIIDEGDNMVLTPVTKYTTPGNGTYQISLVVIVTIDNTLTLTDTDVGISVKVDGVIKSFKSVSLGIGFKFQFNITFDLQLELTSGQEIETEIAVSRAFFAFSSNTIINQARFIVEPISLSFADGLPINISDTLPDISQLDFIKGLIQMFNLYIDTDNRKREVRIETRDNFLLGNNEADEWTDKVDNLQANEIEEISEGVSKKLLFKYKEDQSDINAENYFNAFKIRYGDDEHILQNEFLEGEKEVANLPWAATLMGYGFDGDVYLPVLEKEQDGSATFEFEPRICVYNGLRTGDWTFEGSSETEYPYAYFQTDESILSTIQLPFLTLNEKFPFQNGYFQGLKDRYYGDQLRQLDSGRLYKVYLRLSDSDISKLSFRKPKRIDGNYYDLNKIKNYLFGANESTEVELLLRV